MLRKHANRPNHLKRTLMLCMLPIRETSAVRRSGWQPQNATAGVPVTVCTWTAMAVYTFVLV